MYVPFGKSVDDVTFLLNLRHFFCPWLKKTMEHNLRNIHVKYKSPTSHDIEVMVNVKVFVHATDTDADANTRAMT